MSEQATIDQLRAGAEEEMGMHISAGPWGDPANTMLIDVTGVPVSRREAVREAVRAVVQLARVQAAPSA